MKSVDRDLTGIPLQCLLIGETFEEEAVANARLNSTSSPPSVGIEITSMASLYSTLIMRKIQKYKSTNGQTRLSDRDLMYMHAYLSLEHIFPDELSKLPFRHLFGELKLEEVLKVGIVEKSNMSQAPRFMHQTIAEYFVAWFVVERISEYLAGYTPRENALIITAIGTDDSLRHGRRTHTFSRYLGAMYLRKEAIPIKHLSDFFVKRVLEFETYPKVEFTHPVITYYLNALILHVRPIPAEVAKNFMIPLAKTRLKNMSRACAAADHVRIFQFIKEINAADRNWATIVNEDFVLQTVKSSCLEFVKLALDHCKNFVDFDQSFLMELLPKAAQRGDFSIVEYLIKSQDDLQVALEPSTKFAAHLIHNCVINSHRNQHNVIQQKKQILRYLGSINEQIFKENGHAAYTLLANGVHAQLIMELIRMGANAMAQDDKGNNILYINFGREHLSDKEYQDIIMSIPEAPLRELVPSKNDSGDTPLVTLVKFVNPTPTTLEVFKTIGAGFNFITESNGKAYPILAISVVYGRSKNMLGKLVECGATASWKGNNDKTLLHIAAAGGNMEAVEFFLEEIGMDVNCQDTDGLTSLDYVIQRNSKYDRRLSVGLFLHEKGGTFKDPVNSESQSWMHLAAKSGNLQSIQLLVQLGMDTNREDKNGNTPLHMSALTRNPVETPVARFLLKNNTNPEALNREGNTPFHLSLTNDHLPIETFLLLKSKTKIDWSPELATIAMKIVIAKGVILEDDEFLSLVEELEGHGADLNFKDEKGKSFLSIAVKNKDYRCMELLEKKNVNHEEHISAAMYRMLHGGSRHMLERNLPFSAVAHRPEDDHHQVLKYAVHRNATSAVARLPRS